MDLLKSFVIGSSLPVILPFDYVVYNIQDLQINKETYPIKVATYFGSMNALSKIIGDYFNWNLKKRLYVIYVISILCIIFLITFIQPYNFTCPIRWVQQYILIIIGHAYAYLFAIYNLEKLFQ